MQNTMVKEIRFGENQKAPRKRSKEEIEQLSQLLAYYFKGRVFRVPFQKDCGEWLPTKQDALTAIKAHLSYTQTTGVYPIDENYQVHMVAFDIDNHAEDYDAADEFELIHNKVLPLVHYYKSLGISQDQILIENSGAGFHIFMWLDKELPLADAVTFLKLGADEYDGVEIFPPNAQPEKYGKLIRLPLGAHRKRLLDDSDRAYSSICEYKNGMPHSITAHEDIVEKLKSWQPVTYEQIEKIVEPDKKRYVVSDIKVRTTGALDIIKQKEKRACIRQLLEHPTKIGVRGRTAFDFALYLRWVLLLEKETVWNLLYDWRTHLTFPTYETQHLLKNFNGACSDKYRNWPRCKMNKTMLRYCRECGLENECQYHTEKSLLPVQDNNLFVKLVRSRCAEDSILLSLYKIYHNKSDNPFLEPGEFRTDKYEIVRNSKVERGKKEYKVSEFSVTKSKFKILETRGDIAFKCSPGSKFYCVKLLNL